MSSLSKGIFFAALAGALWGTYGTFVTFLAGFGFSDSAIAAFAPVAMIVFFFFSTLIRNPKGLIPQKKHILVYIVVGIIGVLGTNYCYSLALSSGLSVGVASVITFCNYFIVMIFSRAIWKVKITPIKIIAGLVCILGIAILLQVWTDIAFSTIGLILVFVVTMTFAISYTLCSFSLNNLEADPDAYYFWTNLIGFILLLFINPPWSIVSEIVTCVSNHGFVVILALLGFGLLPQVGSFFFLGRAFLRVSVPITVIMFALDPIVASLLGWVLFDQILNFTQMLGMAIIIASLIVLQLQEKKELDSAKEANTDTV